MNRITKIREEFYVFPIIALAFLYFFTGKMSLLFLHGNNIVNIGIFLSEGVSLAFILFFGKRVWPGVFLGQFFLAYTNDITTIASLGIAVVNSCEAVVAYMLFHKFKFKISLKDFKDIFGLIFIILFIQLFSAYFANIILMVNQLIPPNSLLESSFSWWFGNIMGQLLITPFLLLLFQNYKKINLLEYFLYILLFGIFIYFLEVVLHITNLMLLLSFTVPVIVFVVSYKGFTYGVALSVVLAFISSYSVYVGIGAFYLDETLDNVINYNLFVLAHISVVFISGVLFEERKRNLLYLESTIAEEINKNKEQQLLLLQQSRLAQMGEMIAMIAHQWRQPLNNLSLANQLLISKYNKGKLNPQVMENFKENSHKQITHMSTTIDDFRNFFKSDQEKKEFYVNDVVQNILNIMQDIYTIYGIKLDFKEEKSLRSIGYPNELGQAVLNIINNSKDALQELNTEEKFIKIRLAQKEDKVTITIEDNGGGIPDSIADKIFNPYFSTKESKNGTGLGLYMTKMIINEKLNGNVFFSNTSTGVLFEIALIKI